MVQAPRIPRKTGVRAEMDHQGRHFEHWTTQRGVSDGPGEGRRPLGEEAA